MYNKKTGVTYVYESESYWDKEKQQPRNRRKLIGKIDPKTGEIVPTGRPGRKPRASTSADVEQSPSTIDQPERESNDYSNLLAIIEEKNREISSLKDRIRELEVRCERVGSIMDRMRSILNEFED
ncbi:MAG: hypothetical protein ACI381_06085 [Candidatus Methanomethylophilaceae archaeon]